MKLSQLIESFVISNDEFEDYLNRATEQLAQELQSGKNARDAIHDLSLTFADQHNKAYDAYVRMQDALTARMHTLELDAASAGPADMMNEPMADMGDEMGAPEMGGEPEMMTDPMGDMEMNTPADDEMPSDSDMDDYAAVMDNEPEAEEVEESVNVDESGILYKAGVKKYGKEGMKAIQSASGKGASAEEIGKIKDQHRKKKTEAVVEGDDKPYICVHAKKGKHECHAKSSYAAAQKAAEHWKLKSTAGIDAHLAVEESAEISVSESMEVINKIVADKQAGKLHGMTVDMFTASAIKQIYDAVSDANKAKLDDLMTSKEGVVKAANIAMKMMNEGKYKSDAQRKAVHAAKAEKANEADVIADKIMHTSTRASFSEYNAFYNELDKAAKAGKKAGDTITVGGKNIKLKSNPKQMHQLSDSDMDAIDALAQRLNEKGCSSKMKK